MFGWNFSYAGNCCVAEMGQRTGEGYPSWGTDQTTKKKIQQLWNWGDWRGEWAQGTKSGRHSGKFPLPRLLLSPTSNLIFFLKNTNEKNFSKMTFTLFYEWLLWGSVTNCFLGIPDLWRFRVRLLPLGITLFHDKPFLSFIQKEQSCLIWMWVGFFGGKCQSQPDTGRK